MNYDRIELEQKNFVNIDEASKIMDVSIKQVNSWNDKGAFLQADSSSKILQSASVFDWMQEQFELPDLELEQKKAKEAESSILKEIKEAKEEVSRLQALVPANYHNMARPDGALRGILVKAGLLSR